MGQQGSRPSQLQSTEVVPNPPKPIKPVLRRPAADLFKPSPFSEKIPEMPKIEHYSGIEKFQRYYKNFDEYLRTDKVMTAHSTRQSARTKLARLTTTQMYELSTDVNDELNRRISPKRRYLPPTDGFHPKRNIARRKLSTLPEGRFQDLLGDVHYEISRRYPNLNRHQDDEIDEKTSKVA